VNLSQWLHIISLILGGIVVVLGIYAQTTAAAAVGAFVVVANSIGAYVGGTSASSTSSSTGPVS